MAALGVGMTLTAAARSEPPTLPRTKAEQQRIEKTVAATRDFSQPERFEERPGGAATSFKKLNKNAFSQPSANMPFERELLFKVGNGLFKKLWVAAPSSTIASDGLGPLYNARSCQRCHLKDGRGHPPQGPEDTAVSMLLKLSVPVEDADLVAGMADHVFETAPEPTYGEQLQDFAVLGHPAEGRWTVAYDEILVELSEGETASLRRPRYEINGLGYGPAAPVTLVSPRVAPPMIGLGLLEAIPEQDLIARADPLDADGDGISGRARMVLSPELKREALGRFSWKGSASTVMDQSAAAFSGDMGLSTPFHPQGWGECSPAQPACRAAMDGGSPEHDGVEVGEEALDLVTFYARNLAVPARRDVGEAEVLRGKQVFYQTGCAACHTPKHVTNRFPIEGEAARPEQSFQLIWPYTDLLLHDMGAGLADGRPEGDASGREWRTPPLWGIGLTETVNGHSFFLHDGRARNLLEAVLWHGGEAQTARDRIVAAPKADRAALIRFLESL
ncbi:MAG: c-type cytochrome [Rhodobacteraceae bacterium]|nr:c-type cytochrome [Paracoccaceae bacterium]